MPLGRLQRYNGGVVDWENALLPHGTAFVVELPAGPVPTRRVEPFTDAIDRLTRP